MDVSSIITSIAHTLMFALTQPQLTTRQLRASVWIMIMETYSLFITQLLAVLQRVIAMELVRPYLE
jgi:hypothetical protein